MTKKDTHKEKLLASVSGKVPRPDQREPDKILTPEEEVQLKDSATRLVAIGRRSTEQAFDYGMELAKVQAILPAKRFGAWLTANVGISTKSAKMSIGVVTGPLIGSQKGPLPLVASGQRA